MIVVVSLAHAPWSSQTVKVTVWTAGPSPTVTVGPAPVAVAPPPRAQAYVRVSPGVSVAAPCSVRVDPSFAVYGPPVWTTGGAFTYSVALATRAPGSPVTVTVCAPAGVDELVGTVTAAEPGSPSGPAVAPGEVVRPIEAGSPTEVEPRASAEVSVKLAVLPRWTVWVAGASASA